MGSKKIVMGVIILIIFVGLTLFVKSIASKGKSDKASLSVQARKDTKKAPTQKIISKGKGALTVKISNSKNAEIPMRIKAFKAIDGKTSVYVTSSVGGRMQEVTPGTYDIEVDTIPQKIFKNVKVSEGKETVEDLGPITGSVLVKTANAKKAATFYPMRILYSKTNDMITAYMTNKAIEVVPGVYDIEIGTSPKIYKKDVKVDAGKETVLDMGCVVGALIVKTVGEDGKNVRSNVKITKADTNEVVSSGLSNKPIDIGKGTYNVEVFSVPKQSKKNVKIDPGEEMVVDFIVKSPVVPQKSAAPKAAAAKLKQ